MNETNARKETHQGEYALELTRRASKLYVAKGKKVNIVDLKKDRPDDEQLLKLMLGPTGNLRAPTLVVGKNLIIGFNQEMYEEIFG